jgi:hypothetical protein
MCSIAFSQQKGMTQSDQVNFVPYSNPTFGIRTDYPSDWGRIDLSFLKNNSSDIEFYPLDDTSGTKQVKIQVDTIPLDQKMTLQELNNAKIGSIMGEILESNATVLADLPAHKMVFSNLGIKTMQVWTIEDNRIYTITYVAEEEDFEEDFQVAERMIHSFEIEE